MNNSYICTPHLYKTLSQYARTASNTTLGAKFKKNLVFMIDGTRGEKDAAPHDAAAGAKWASPSHASFFKSVYKHI